MDTDLFQGVLLGLLAVGLIVLIALLATLGGIKRALEQRSSERDEASFAGVGARPQPQGSEAGAERRDETEEPAPSAAQGYTGAGSYATPRGSQETSHAPAAGAQADTIRSVLAAEGVTEGTAAEAAPAAESEESAVDSAFAAHADDPQEEPFQRDGRWWFRRGDELLLYDEATGQWQPAPEGAGQTPAPGGAGGAAGAPASQGAAAATQTAGTPAVADQVATYWKCPTCGAVNGSTAATCRMCFAARP